MGILRLIASLTVWPTLFAVLAAPGLAEEVPPRAQAPLGTWEQRDTKEPNLVRFEQTRLAQFKNGQLRFTRINYENGQLVRLGFAGHKEPAERFEVKGKVLVLTDARGKQHTFNKLDKDPPELLIAALRFGERKALKEEEVKPIQKELARREEANLRVRTEWRELKGKAEAQAAKLKEMEKIDADDTAYFIRLVKKVGWIDSMRFGDRAENSAYLIVMHTRDLSLMQAALPELKKEVLAKRFEPEMFAGLHDRFRTIVALPERYGMHVTPDENGMLVVGPLEDPKRVDEYRKEIGLPPLREYLKRYQDENGGKEVRVQEK
jgi:hypothetical protein